MLDFTALLYKLIEIFLYICIGYICRAIGIFKEQANKAFSNYIVYVGGAMVLLGAMINTEQQFSVEEVLRILLVTFVFTAFMIVVCLLIARLFARGGSEWGNYAYMLAFGNIGIFGLPVLKPLFGAEGVFIAVLFNVPFSLAVYSVGILMIQGGRNKGVKIWRLMLSPVVVTSVLMPILYCLHLSYPKPLVTVVTTLGDTCLPLLMFTVGSTLRTMPLREMVGNWKVDCTVALKLVLIPLLISPLLRLVLRNDPLLQGVTIMICCMPVAGAATAMNILFGEHEKESGAAVFLSTLLSLLTIPLMVRLLLM